MHPDALFELSNIILQIIALKKLQKTASWMIPDDKEEGGGRRGKFEIISRSRDQNRADSCFMAPAPMSANRAEIMAKQEEEGGEITGAGAGPETGAGAGQENITLRNIFSCPEQL